MVIADTPPETTGIQQALPVVDFQDTFAVTNHTDSLGDIGNLIFSKPPSKVIWLFYIRNFIVKFFGLEASAPEDFNTEFKVGGYVGFFKIYSIEDKELILGANDKHLNFRVSIYDSGSETHNIKVTTLVQFNNTFGKVYMKIIQPFHYLVVKAMVKRAYKG